ncbi:hypothetical protein [Amycolatopsis sp. GA6-003]|uniref:hypothetical protein n=1 Tax=Amycolatopsis sp. GA6-003 TaxID=2652444 RepID=UPI003916DD54
MTAAGESLIGFVESFGEGSGQKNLVPDSGWPGTREEWFLCRFVSAVAGEGTTIADAVARRSAAVCAPSPGLVFEWARREDGGLLGQSPARW